MSETADEAGLSAAYGEFQQEAVALKPGYAPQSVNTDGWEGTQLAWKSLFPGITLMLCFLHTVLGIQRAMGRKCQAFNPTTDRLWQVYHSPTRRCFGQRVRRLLEWTSTQAMPQKAQQQLEKLAQRDGYEHCLLENGVLVYTGDTITYVGKHYQGESGRTIDATGKLIIPGQISTHTHVGIQEGSRAILDNGKPEFSRAFFLNYLPTKLNGGSTYLGSQDSTASVCYGMASLIRHGVTTVINFAPGGVQEGLMMADLATEFGLRLYSAPIVTSGSYHFDHQGRLKQCWNEAAGLKALEGVVEFVEQLTSGQKRYVTPIITVDEAFFITPDLLQRARELASRLKLRLTLHAAEQLFEFHDAIRQQGKTPIGALADAGILDTDVILAHCIYVSGHSATGYPFGQDLEILAQSGATIAHSPTVQARRGIALESFQRYLDAGVNLALATDSYPLDMLGEMRSAAQVGKVTDQRYDAARSQDIFNASNLAGACALGRSDLGRLSVGAKADIVLIDFDNLAIGPVYDPIRSLVHLANSEMVDTVIIDGRTVLENKQLLVCSEQEILQSAKKFSQKYWSTAADRHWAGEAVEKQFPRSLKIWEETVNEIQAGI